jgi:hypothetical protein
VELAQGHRRDEESASVKSAERAAVLAVLAVAVALIWAYPWLERHRHSLTTGGAAGPEFLVTSPFDRGPGSLRSALFAALRSDGPSIVVIRPETLVVQNPLPPLAGIRQVTVRSEHNRAEIDASALAGVPLFDVRAQSATFDNIAIRGAEVAGIRAVGEGELTLSRVRISESAVGVGIGGDVRVTLTAGELTGNRIGVELLGGGRASIADTFFKDQRDAGVWMVRALSAEPSEAHVTDSTFEGGRYGLVLGNADTRVTGGAIRGFSADGIIALGGRLEVSGVRMSDARGSGIRATGAESVVIEHNEIHDVRGLGILLQAAAYALVDDNQLYRNGYGIATLTSAPAAVKLSNNLLIAQDIDGVVVLGDSPLVMGNRALRNGFAGIRIFNLSAPGLYSKAAPLLVDNVLEDNGLAGTVFGEYTVVSAAKEGR